MTKEELLREAASIYQFFPGAYGARVVTICNQLAEMIEKTPEPVVQEKRLSRDEFAAAALMGICCKDVIRENEHRYAKVCYAMADAMIKERDNDYSVEPSTADENPEGERPSTLFD